MIQKYLYFAAFLALIAIVARKIGKFPGLVFLTACYSACFVFQNPVSPYTGTSMEWMTVLDYVSMQAFSTLCIVTFAAFALPVRTWLKIFKGLVFINSSMILTGFRYGILINASMSGCLNAVIFPFLGWKGRIFVGLAILLTGRHQPIGLLCLILMAEWVFGRRRLRGGKIMLTPSPEQVSGHSKR